MPPLRHDVTLPVDELASRYGAAAAATSVAVVCLMRL